MALKIIKLGMDTKSVIARFEAERQTLAMMEHPNIAHVLDAGETATGRPFFVMELVHGVKITTYCEENCLSIRQRLDHFNGQFDVKSFPGQGTIITLAAPLKQ